MFIRLFTMCRIVHKIGPGVGRGRPGPGPGLAAGCFGLAGPGLLCWVAGRRAPGVVPGGRLGAPSPSCIQS